MTVRVCCAVRGLLRNRSAYSQNVMIDKWFAGGPRLGRAVWEIAAASPGRRNRGDARRPGPRRLAEPAKVRPVMVVRERF